jgi:hypothetical protein
MAVNRLPKYLIRKIEEKGYFDIPPEERVRRIKKDLMDLSANRKGNYEAGEKELMEQRGSMY